MVPRAWSHGESLARPIVNGRAQAVIDCTSTPVRNKDGFLFVRNGNAEMTTETASTKTDQEPTRATRPVELYDTTLRDGAQQEGISLSVEDKLTITQLLDEFGVDIIEG